MKPDPTKPPNGLATLDLDRFLQDHLLDDWQAAFDRRELGEAARLRKQLHALGYAIRRGRPARLVKLPKRRGAD